jgi:hypothetical protein
MKAIIAAIGLFCFSTLACAEVSDDLKFCGARKSAPERLACFEAVTRGASRPGPARPAARAVPLDVHAAVPVKAAALDPLPARNPFDGYYAAIGGGYGVATGRDFASVTNRITEAFFEPSTMSGASATIAAGRNIAIGWGLVGVELAGRWGGERYKDAHTGQLYFCCGGPSGFGAYSYQSDAGVHASLRAGATFGDLLIFGKAGIGATHVAETFFVDGASLRADSWLPSVLLGLGIEKNWGPFFGRLSADFEAFNHQSTDVSGAGNFSGRSGVDHMTWTTRGTAMIGVRF